MLMRNQVQRSPLELAHSQRMESSDAPVGMGFFLVVETMTIQWYRLAVFALWLSAMSWLTVRKILPPFFVGEPPVYEAATEKPRPAVGWYLYLNKSRLGWALSEFGQQSGEMTQIHSLVHFNRLPLRELLPPYMRLLVSSNIGSIGNVDMEVESDLISNSALNQLVSFYSRFRPKGAQTSIVRIDGNAEGDKLKIVVKVGDPAHGDFTHEFSMPLQDTNIRNSFSPEMTLRGLRVGQSWTIISFNPLALPSSTELFQGRAPTEVLFAKVEEQTQMTWNGRPEPTWVVVYRSDTNEGPEGDKNIRNRLWVLRDGTVVRQEVFLGDACLSFEQMPEKDADSLRSEHPDFLREPMPARP
jgi:hypothetical protein